MYCPRCAKAFDAGTSYCRTCGLSLDGVSGIVKGEAATEPEMKRRPNASIMRIGIACFIFGTVIALANAMVRDLGLFPEALGKYVFMTLVIVGMTLIGGGVVFPQRRYIKKKTAKPTAGADNYLAVLTTPLTGLPSADRNVEGFNVPRDPAEPIPVPSVTESTTRNLN